MRRRKTAFSLDWAIFSQLVGSQEYVPRVNGETHPDYFNELLLPPSLLRPDPFPSLRARLPTEIRAQIHRFSEACGKIFRRLAEVLTGVDGYSEGVSRKASFFLASSYLVAGFRHKSLNFPGNFSAFPKIGDKLSDALARPRKSIA